MSEKSTKDEKLMTFINDLKKQNITLERKLPKGLKRKLLIEDVLYRNYPIKAAMKQWNDEDKSKKLELAS